MSRFYPLLFFLFSVLFSACTNPSEPWKEPGEAAVKYYTYLIREDYDHYLSAIYSLDSVPSDYRGRMRILMKQYIAREKEENGGLKTAELDTAYLSKDGATANVFLTLTYGNKMKEVVVVPLVKKNKIWRLH